MTSLPIHLLFLVNLVIIGSAYLILARKGFIFSSLWLGLLVYVAIGYSDIDNAERIFREDVIISSLAYAMFASVSLLACFVAFWYIMSAGQSVEANIGLPPPGPLLVDLSSCAGRVKLLFVALVLASFVSLILLYGPDTFRETWGDRRLLDSKFAIVPGMLADMAAMLPGLFLLVRQPIWTALSLVTAVLMPIVMGGRAIMVTAIASLYLSVLVQRGPRLWVRLLPLVALPLALAVHTFLRLTRGTDLVDLMNGSIIDILWEQSSHGIDWFGGERAPFRGFLYVVQTQVWNSIPGSFETIHRMVLFWLPHEILDKPADVIEWVWRRSMEDGYMGYIASPDYGFETERVEALKRSLGEGSLHCTLWGEILANGGYLAAMPVIFFLAFVFAAEEVIAARLSPMMRYGFATAMIAQYLYISRGATVSSFTGLMFEAPVWGGIVLLLGLPLFKRSTAVPRRI